MRRQSQPSSVAHSYGCVSRRQGLAGILGLRACGHASVRSGGCVLAHFDDWLYALIVEVAEVAFRVVCAIANRLGDLAFLGGFLDERLEVE